MLQSYFGDGLTPDDCDVEICEEHRVNLDSAGTTPVKQHESAQISAKLLESAGAGGSNLTGEPQCHKIIFHKEGIKGKASRFFGCSWRSGQIYPYETVGPSSYMHMSSPLASPTTLMRQKKWLGTEMMQSTYRLISTFVSSSGETRSAYGSAVAVSPKTAMTAAHVLRHFQKDASGNVVEWELKSIKIYADEVVNHNKLIQLGSDCEVLGTYKPCPRWGSINECPETGEDVVFLKMSETVDQFALPSSPQTGMRVMCYGFPGARSFLQKASSDLRNDNGGGVWKAYWETIWENIKALVAECEGDMIEGQKKAKVWLLKELHDMLYEIPEGAQTVSAGVIEDLSDCFVTHTCSSLPGASGGGLSPMDCPGYIVACQCGALTCNKNCATSTDNPSLVEGYMLHALPELPPPDSKYFQRNDLPFKRWLLKHIDQVPQDSPWYKVLFDDSGLLRDSKRKKLEL